MRLLIVEDEPGIALMMEDVAIDAGFEIAGIAGNMSEALELGSEADIAIIDDRTRLAVGAGAQHEGVVLEFHPYTSKSSPTSP